MAQQYVSFPALGQFGRLGNAMFQVAATAAHAWRLGLEPRFPPWKYQKAFDLPQEWFSLEQAEPYTECAHTECVLRGDVYRSGWNYQPIPDEARVLYGYFQSPRWWEGYGDIIRELFWPPRAESLAAIVMHVRRQDYLKLPQYHPVLPFNYYRAALLSVEHAWTGIREEVPPTIIVSDDSPWAHKTFYGALISTGDELMDMCLLTRATTKVIANSSFSWWGAYLSPGSIVYYPKQWFGPALAELDATQLFMPDWKGIDS